MSSLEQVVHTKDVIALVVRNSHPVSDVAFLTEPTNPFQLGLQQRKKGTHLPAHVHRLEKPLTIETVQEILYVISGKISVSLYTEKGSFIEAKILESGDSILLMSGGHGVDFLEDSKLFEVKQGPYPGKAYAKRFLEE